MPFSALPCPIGINSIKRTSSLFFFANSARLFHSSSLTPFCRTVLIFTRISLFSAMKMDFLTLSSSSAPVISWYFSGISVSRLIFTASSPAARRSSRFSPRRTPFVVIVTSSVPGICRIIRIRSAHPFLTRGSPPVILNLVIPIRTASLQIRSISS